MKVYLDNAATTPLDPEVYVAMEPYLKEHFGNPSSIHAHGRATRSAIEQSRKKIADLLNASPSEIFFTSGGTEADNMSIRSAVDTNDIKHAITSSVEHHAVLHPLQELEKAGRLKVSYVALDEKGSINHSDLENLLSQNPKSLVSLMHGNNEIGNITDINAVGDLCRNHGAFFHSDTVQTIGHFPIDLQSTKVDFITGTAHKFHGPKGAGFIYINSDRKIRPLIYGGAQERNMRGGTENVYGIVGLAKAMELAYQSLENDQNHITGLKKQLIENLQQIPGLTFNGLSGQIDKSLYTVLSLNTPPTLDNEMLLFNMDIAGISISGGSACTSGTSIGSHVIEALNPHPDAGVLRLSLSKYNTSAEIDYVVEKIKEILPSK